MKRIAVATFSRSDYSSCLPVMRAIQADAALDLRVVVSGSHLSAVFGRTVDLIEADGFAVDERIDTSAAYDADEAVAAAVGAATGAFASALQRVQPDLLLIVGDRIELLAAATAALICRVPLAHVSGGDVTEGAVDNQVRHAVTKMSHVHFVAMPTHAERLCRMGEEPWRVHVTGDPALDLVRSLTLMTRDELARHLGIALQPPLLLATYHPTTLGARSAEAEIDIFLGALDRVPGTIIITYPNADPGHAAIVDRLRRFAADRARVRLIESLGQTPYFSAMAAADLLVGNSSSAIWEAPSFACPAVDVGDRQQGRDRAPNVVHAACELDAIVAAIADALRPEFRARLGGLANPYGDGHAAPRIASVLKQLEPGIVLLRKRFDDHVRR